MLLKYRSVVISYNGGLVILCPFPLLSQRSSVSYQKRKKYEPFGKAIFTSKQLVLIKYFVLPIPYPFCFFFLTS